MTSTKLIATKAKLERTSKQLAACQDQFQAALPKGMDAGRLVRIAENCCRKIPKLLDCKPASLYGAIMAGAELGLMPDGRHGTIVPFAGEAVWISMYQGLCQIAYRSGLVTTVCSATIFENDEFIWNGPHSWPDHTPYWLVGEGKQEDDPGQPLGAWAGFGMTTGGVHVETMSMDAILKIKKQSRGADKPDSPWNHPEHRFWMFRKTCVRAAAKEAPQSTEMMRALDLEDRADVGKPQDLPVVNIPHVDVPEEPQMPKETTEPETPQEEAQEPQKGGVDLAGVFGCIRQQQSEKALQVYFDTLEESDWWAALSDVEQDRVHEAQSVRSDELRGLGQ